MKIPITKPTIGDTEEAEVLDALRSSWVSMGPKVKEFEDLIAKYVGAKHGVATSSCTTALHLALILKGIKEFDEVIVPSYTFVASANSILYTGATPVFVDIDPMTYNIDATKIEPAITKNTKGIMVVHQVGLSADMDVIEEIAKKHNLWIIEDAACALGAEYKGKRIGSISDMTCFSFHPRKAITTGDGGMVTTNDDELARKLRVLRSHGADVSDLARHSSDKIIFEDYPVLGYNYRMTDLQGALGIAQFQRLDSFIAMRRKLAARYSKAFDNHPDIMPPVEPDYAKHVYQSYMITLGQDVYMHRTDIMSDLLDMGVAVRRGIPSIHRLSFYRKQVGTTKLPNSEYASDAALMIPLYPLMTDEEQDFVIDSIKKVVDKYKR